MGCAMSPSAYGRGQRRARRWGYFPASVWRRADRLPAQTYFDRCTPHLTTTAPARIPFLSLLLTFLCRHPGKAYHVLSTSLLSHLITFCLTSPSPAAVTLGMKCLAIFLTALPVIIGEDVLMGIFAVYGRVVCWETLDLEGLDGDGRHRELFGPLSRELTRSSRRR